MARRLLVDAVDRIGLTRRGSIRLTSAAHNGEVANGGWDTDDDAAALSFPGLKVARLIEDASGSDKHVWRGRIWLKNLGRGDWLMGNALRYGVTAVDSNWDFTKLRVHGVKRPAESDVARVLWLVGYILNGSSSTVTTARKRATTVFGVSLYVPNTNLVTLPARGFDSVDPFAVLDDCIKASGKDFFAVLLDDGTLELFYDLPTSVAYASTLSITDDGTADGITSYAPGADGPAGIQDPSELLSGAGLVDSTGKVSTSFDGAVETANDVAETTIYDQGATPATAADRLTKVLTQRGVEEDRYRCFIEVTPAKAHLLKAGMTLSFRSAAAGVTSPVTVRVVRCEPELTLQNLYRLHLELNFPEKIAARITNSGVIPIQGQGQPISQVEIAYLRWTFPNAPPVPQLDDLTSTYNLGLERSTPQPGYYAPADAAFGVGWGRNASGEAGNSMGIPVVAGFTYYFLFDALWAPDGISGRDITVFWNGPNSRTDTIATESGHSMDTLYTIHNNFVAPAGCTSMLLHFFNSGTTYFDNIYLTYINPPAYAGNMYGPLQIAVADGATSAWTTPYPYIPGTLDVRVDGVTQVSIEDDPAAGTFHLPWTPNAGDIISAVWRVPVGP